MLFGCFTLKVMNLGNYWLYLYRKSTMLELVDCGRSLLATEVMGIQCLRLTNDQQSSTLPEESLVHHLTLFLSSVDKQFKCFIIRVVLCICNNLWIIFRKITSQWYS